MENSERTTIDISELHNNPENAFKTAANKQSVIHVIDEDNVAGVLMSKAQYEFARDEIENLYDVIDELTVSESLATSDETTYAAEEPENINLKMMKFDKDQEWD